MMVIRESGKARSAWPACVLSIASLASAPALQAAEATYGVSIGAGLSDNITRVESNEIDETIATAGFNLDLAHESRVLNADVGAALAYFDYLDNTYDGEVIGGLDADLRFSFIPERFEWMLADNFGQVRQSTAAVTPENRENINFLTTGPDLTLALGDVTRLRLGGRYSLVTYEESPFDNDRLQGTVSLIRNLSGASSVSLNAMSERVEFDDVASSSDFDRQEAYFRYELGGARTQLGLDLGYTLIEDAFDEENDGVMVRFNVARVVSPATTLSLELGSEFSDSGNIFRQYQSTEGVSLATQAVQTTAVPFENRFVTLGWDFSRNRTGFGLGLSRFEEIYEGLPALDREYSVLDARFRRDLSRVLSFQLSAAYSQEEPPSGAAGDFNDLRGQADLNWRLGRLLSLNLQYQRFERSSDVAADEYAENLVWLRLGYGTVSAETPALNR